jgi:hypothetical protein|tara:strand:- start:21 stop:188 length:168 start_codon:yes stop_codon:yes gene_type:complete
MDLNKNELNTLFNFLNHSLKKFETDFLEKEFWNNTYKLDELINVRDKIRDVLNRA